jgi:energy-coupling factor transporter ATP-binding protein EcfA2
MDEANSELSGIKYSAIFNDKVENFLATKDFKDKLFEYTTIYDNLVSNSTFFRKGVFNHYQASEIAKSLNSHGFFKAEHSIYLNPNNEKREVKTEAELLELIQNEKNAILKNHKLSSAFSELDEKLKANSELRDFREFLLNHQELLPEFSNPELLKEKLWKSYLIKQKEHFMSLMEVYNEGKYRLQSITDKASQEATQWQEVINIFNRRFSVPFVVGIENKQDVILRRVTPNLHFQYVDGSELIPVERSLLTDVLSNGEKRALYILNIIFEVEARKLSRTKTLFVIDDIADSFDYKNKYAIIEYLNDILHEENFRQIILTHNFDFYRTVSTRLELSGNNFHICKAHNNLSLEADTMYKDRFKLWKDNVCKGENKKMLIALIPFARNIAEHCGLSNEVNQLTALLHVKENTDSFTVIDLEEIFKKVFNGSISNLVDRQQNVKQMIYDEAKKILNDDTYKLDLENKIALSIAIRLKSEDFMIKKIDDINVVSNIRSNQTATLIKKYKEKYGGFKLLTQKRNNFKKVF